MFNGTVDRTLSSLCVLRKVVQLIESRGKLTPHLFDNEALYLSISFHVFYASCQNQFTKLIQPG